MAHPWQGSQDLQLREGHRTDFPNVVTSPRFAVKWGNKGNFSRERAQMYLQELERMWTIMTGEAGFDQTRGWEKQKRGLEQPGAGSYLGCDPKGVHFISTFDNVHVLAHELGHLAEMGTYGFINHPKVGWIWEACANWFQWYFYRDNPDDIVHYLNHHQEPLDNFETRYQTWFFFKYLTERFGPQFVGSMWSTAQQDELPFEVIQRLLPQIPFQDIFADFASRTVVYDFVTLGARFREMAGDQAGWSRLDHVIPVGVDGCYASAPDSKLHWYGFEVINIKALLPDATADTPHWQQRIKITFRAQPYPQDWRAVFVTWKHDGSCSRGLQPWNGSSQTESFIVSSDDREVLLVVCPAGRHDDTTETPTYTLTLQPWEQQWACPACTYINAGQESFFTSCHMCQTPQPAAAHVASPDAFWRRQQQQPQHGTISQYPQIPVQQQHTWPAPDALPTTAGAPTAEGCSNPTVASDHPSHHPTWPPGNSSQPPQPPEPLLQPAVAAWGASLAGTASKLKGMLSGQLARLNLQQPDHLQQHLQQQQQQQLAGNQAWACPSCTYLHEGTESGLHECAMCGGGRYW